MRSLICTNVLFFLVNRTDPKSRLEALGEFSSLHRYFVHVCRHKRGMGQEVSEEKAVTWCECWKALGYNYRRMLEMVVWYKNQVRERGERPDAINRKLWDKLNAIRDRLPQGDSASYVVDRTLEHYNMVIEKRIKERARMAAVKKEQQQQQQQPPEMVTLVSLLLWSLYAFFAFYLHFFTFQDSPEQKPPQQVQQQQPPPVQQPPQQQQQQPPQMDIRKAVGLVQVEFHDFLKKKLRSDSDVAQVLAVVKLTQVHPSTLVAWFEIESERNGGSIPHFPTLLTAYFTQHQSHLPPSVALKFLVTLIVSFCIETTLKGVFKLPEAYKSYDDGVAAVLRARAMRQPPPQQQPPQQQPPQQQQQPPYGYQGASRHPPPRPQTPPHPPPQFQQQNPPPQFQQQQQGQQQHPQHPPQEFQPRRPPPSAYSQPPPKFEAPPSPPPQGPTEPLEIPSSSPSPPPPPQSQQQTSGRGGADEGDRGRRRREGDRRGGGADDRGGGRDRDRRSGGGRRRRRDSSLSSASDQGGRSPDRDRRHRRDEDRGRRMDASLDRGSSRGSSSRQQPNKEPQKKLDARTIRFGHQDSGFSLLPSHPLNKVAAMTGELQDKLAVFCHMEV